MVESDYRIYVGIDWASAAHQACGLDHERRIVAKRSFAHAGNAIVEFAQWLSGLVDDPGQVAITIEIPRGAVVETLVERGFHVYAIKPKQLDHFRDRYSMSSAIISSTSARLLGFRNMIRSMADLFEPSLLSTGHSFLH